MNILSRFRRGRETAPAQAPVEEYNEMYAPPPPDYQRPVAEEPAERVRFSRRDRLKSKLFHGGRLPEVSGDYDDEPDGEVAERVRFSRRDRLKSKLFHGGRLPEVSGDYD